jgi:hypothetical protein
VDREEISSKTAPVFVSLHGLHQDWCCHKEGSVSLQASQGISSEMFTGAAVLCSSDLLSRLP